MALPMPINEQDRLLTINIHKEPGIDFGEYFPGLKLWPLYLDPEAGVWVLYAKYGAGMRMPTHFHTGAVHFFTTKGRWNYAEYPDDVQTEGSYLYEPPGSVHSLSIPEDSHDTEGFMVVTGVNINFDENGEYIDTAHAGSMEESILQMAKAQGIAMPRYIRPLGKAGYTTGG
jgi:hypothetical protein